jgi:GNAT superfamily N-acetyltransferase
MIDYSTDRLPTVEQVIALYAATTLGERRPIGEPDRVAAMLEHANLVIAAWDGDELVGLARSFSDFAYVTYVADLAVRESHQSQGIGKELLRRTQAAASPEAWLVLLAAPQAEGYYPHIGMENFTKAFVLRPGDRLRSA